MRLLPATNGLRQGASDPAVAKATEFLQASHSLDQSFAAAWHLPNWQAGGVAMGQKEVAGFIEAPFRFL